MRQSLVKVAVVGRTPGPSSGFRLDGTGKAPYSRSPTSVVAFACARCSRAAAERVHAG